VEDLKAKLSAETSKHERAASAAATELSALREKLMLSEKRRDGGAAALDANVGTSSSGVGSKREQGTETVKNRISLFNDGTESGLAHENKMLRERLKEMEASMHRDRQEHSKSMQVIALCRLGVNVVMLRWLGVHCCVNTMTVCPCPF
jgi:hypothetical protein